MFFLVCLVLEEALAWKCVPRGQCGFFELKFMTFSLRFFVTFFHRAALGNGNFGLHVQACFQIAVFSVFICSELLSWVLAEHFGHFLLQRVLKIVAESPNQKKPEFSGVWCHKIMTKTPIAVLACKRVSRGQCGVLELFFHTF